MTKEETLKAIQDEYYKLQLEKQKALAEQKSIDNILYDWTINDVEDGVEVEVEFDGD